MPRPDGDPLPVEIAELCRRLRMERTPRAWRLAPGPRGRAIGREQSAGCRGINWGPGTQRLPVGWWRKHLKEKG
jgi:hypothetical protein